MEFGKLKGFWNATALENDVRKHNKNTNNNSSSSNRKIEASEFDSKSSQSSLPRNVDVLEEIKPEITSEGYGLRTPYGTHLNLDFVKYCEDITSGQQSKRSFSRPRQRTISSASTIRRHLEHTRLSSEPSTESLDFGESDMGQDDENSENMLMETRRRLEAFRSFRSKRHKTPTESPLTSPSFEWSRNGFGSGRSGREKQKTNGHSARNPSPSSSTSSGGTSSSLYGLPSSNQVTPQHLQIVREQMASALVRLRELEEQVKTIPILQVKISVLQEEKKHLLEELKFKEDRAANGNPSNVAARRKNVLSSSSSGVSSASFQSSNVSSHGPQSKLFPQVETTLHQNHLREPTSDSNVAAPPPPKRKYLSIGTGDNVPIQDIVCYQRSDNALPVFSGETSLAQPTSTKLYKSGGIVSDNLPPMPLVCLVNASTCTEERKSKTSSSQTVQVVLQSSFTQTKVKTFKDTGCGADIIKTRDNHCDPIVVESHDASVMTSTPIKKTRDQCTSSRDLISTNHKAIGTAIRVVEVATNTSSISVASRETSCDGLIQRQDAMSGPDHVISRVDACASTDPVSTRNAATSCKMLATTTNSDHSTMTDSSSGRWVCFSDQSTVSCGPDSEISTRTAATNTSAVTRKDQATATPAIHYTDRSVCADIRPTVNHVSTYTVPVLKYNQATDCFDIRPSLRHNASNTVTLKTSSVSTQYVTVRSNLVDSATSTDVVDTCDASTTTCSANTESIDIYVDKVQSLLEEQQSLLAENYEVFSDEWNQKPKEQRKPENISRFVNPFFCSGEEIEVNASSSTDPISASLSLLKEDPNEDEDISESESDVSDMSDYFISPVLRPATNAGSTVELKSILKKPGTPPGVKKSISFAEGVKSDDESSDTCSTCDESEEDLKENEAKEGEEDKSEEEKDADKELEENTNKEQPQKNIFIETEDKVVKEQFVPVVIEKTEFNYSNEFVKKSTPNNNVTQEEVPNLSEVFPEDGEIKRNTYDDTPAVVESVEMTCYQEQSGETASNQEQQLETTNNQQQAVKYVFTAQVLDACNILERHFKNPKLVDKPTVVFSTSVVQSEWFRIASQADSSRDLLDDFITDLADTSLAVLRKVVNMVDNSGNTVLHYAISHGNIPVVDCLLSIDELDVDKTNQAGYTSAMLASLCDVTSDYERSVFQKLFEKSDVNLHAKEAGQTSLMLAVCHGRLHTAQLLLSCGADVNAKDEDGSTALMCAVEHGQLEAVKMLLSKPVCDATIADSDGSTALSIAMDSEQREIAILLYAQLNLRPAGNIHTQKVPRSRIACKSMIPSPIQKPMKL